MQITLFDSWTSGDRRLSYSSQSPLDWILEVTSQKTKLLERNVNGHIKGLPQVTEKQVSFNFMYIQSFKWLCRMLSNRFLHIAQYIVCNLYWTYLGIVFVCLCLCSVDWLLFVLILLKRQNTSTIDGLSLHCNLIEMWITFQYMWWSMGLALLCSSVHGHLFHITRWCIVTSPVLLFWSSQPSCLHVSQCLCHAWFVFDLC